jgi:hypothetical protein
MNAGPKKYLIVCRSFYPTNSPRSNRATELARELSRQGHAVTVLTPHHPEQEALAREHGIAFIDLGKDRWPHVPTTWRGKPRFVLRLLTRALLQLFEYPSIDLMFRVANALKQVPRQDVIISIAAPHTVHWGVALAARRGGLPAKAWIADCGDPYMGAENDSFRAFFYFQYPEKAFCRRADAIVVPVEGARQAYYPQFRDKIHVVPQGFRFADYAHLKTIRPKEDDTVRFAFAGLLIPGKRDPSRLLEHLVARPEKFEFHVYTKTPALVEPYARRDPRIVLHGFMAREAVLKELAGMDFLVNIENAGGRQTPSKLIDYWLCDRPILSLKSDVLPLEAIDGFFAGEYGHALRIEQPEQYDIANVVRRFDALADAALARTEAERVND